ncbi:sensor protein [Halomicroarcula sp. F28]|uniref:DICT sensory domain-containing protein n=1 Tax=Haloarcula salinisoli TaxID=2487746 RepID=UPI001C72B2F9|nr:DICT sensory domain-containing protein [Halomicroarcula salinisoli]MBX0286186.1 sensor protein [Halomicroarcula salinisoli]
MEALSDQLEAIESRRKTLDVYTDKAATVAELAAQFSTRNVQVIQNEYAVGADTEFMVVRNAEGDPQGALGVEQFRTLIAPDIHPPWERSGTEADLADLFDFLDSTLFTSFSRRQMLAVSREIEERAWRVDTGVLYVGFQNATAVDAQAAVYNRFARRSAVGLQLFIEDEFDGRLDGSIDVVSGEGEEIGRFWFLLFDGGGADQSKCGLLAEEREPGRFYGFWTYRPGIVDEIIDYLRATYDAR